MPRRRNPPPQSLPPHHLHYHPLPALSIELRVVHLLQWAQVQASLRDGDDDLVVYEDALQMRIAVVFSGAVVVVVLTLRRQALQHLVDVPDDAALRVVDVYARRDVHR